MKLQSQTNIYNILYSGLILVFTGFFLQITLVKIYYKQIDDSIRTEREIIEAEIERLDTVPDYSGIFGHQIEVSLLQEPVASKNIFKNLLLYDSKSNSGILYRNHFFAKNRSNRMGYTISILKPLNELHKFKKVVMLSISIAFIILLIASLGTGYFVNRRLWRPFYKTLDNLNQFNLDAPAALNFSETEINEFKQLNQIISSFSLKLKRDYIRMKSFTENLSHEINTILAIIISKIELLLQKEDLTTEQIGHFKTIYQVTNNLTHLNNGLILLAKIDNQYYAAREQIDLSRLIEPYLLTYDDFIRQKNIHITLQLSPCQVSMNNTLADIFISNIIINAIKHNIENGYINISFTNKAMSVENSFQIAKEHIQVESFQTYNDTKPFKSLGLGLEIIRRICRIYNLAMALSNENGLYRIEIGFNK
jgi:signal transduction histidine kinase